MVGFAGRSDVFAGQSAPSKRFFVRHSRELHRSKTGIIVVWIGEYTIIFVKEMVIDVVETFRDMVSDFVEWSDFVE